MARRMSFSKTLPQMRDRSKTVTRRRGWRDLQPGDELVAIEKGMGLKKGESQVVIGRIRVTSVSQGRLDAIDADDLSKEGFPGRNPEEFIALFGGRPDELVMRIEFEHVDGDRCSQ